MSVAPGFLLALAAALAWSTLDLSRRFLADRIRALPLVAWTTLGAVPPLTIWVLFSAPVTPRAGYFAPAALSIALNVVANLAFFRSLQLAPLSETLPLLSLTPVFASVLGALLLDEQVALRAGAGIALVVVGALLLTVRFARVEATGRRAVNVGRGSQLMALVAICWSTTIFLDKVAMLSASPQLHALLSNVGVAVVSLGLLAGRGELGLLTQIRGRIGWLLTAIAVGALAIALQMAALVTVPIGIVETLKRGFGALAAVVLGRILFGERITPGKLAAIALLTAGVALILV